MYNFVQRCLEHSRCLLFLILFASCELEQPLSIAYIGTLSGESMVYGTRIIQAITLAVDQINKSGGIGERQVELLLGDTDINDIDEMIRDLVEIDQVVAAIGPLTSNDAQRILPLINTYHLPVISPSASSTNLTQDSPYFFRTLPSDAVQARILAAYLRDIMATERVSILAVDDAYSRPFSEVFIDSFKKRGGEIEFYKVFPDNDFDINLLDKPLEDLNSDVLLLPLDTLAAINLLYQLSDDFEMQIVGTDTFSRSLLLERSGVVTNGILYSSPPLDGVGIEGSRIQEFEETYYDRFNENSDSFSRNAYDATMLLLQAMRKLIASGDELKNRDTILKAIAQTHDFAGISGNISFNEQGDIYRGVEILRLNEGKRKSQGVYNLIGERLFRLR